MLSCFFKWPHGISQTNIDIWYKQFVAKKVPLRFWHQHTLYTSRHPTQWPTFPHIIHHPVWHASLWRNILCWKWARNREMSSAGNSPQNCCKPWWAHMGHQGPSLASKETTDKDPEHINCKFSRSYCFATVLSKRQQAGVEIRNGFSAMPLPMTVCVCSGRQAAGVAGLEKGLFPIPFMTESTICTQSFAKATWKNPCGIERTRCKKGHAKRDASQRQIPQPQIWARCRKWRELVIRRKGMKRLQYFKAYGQIIVDDAGQIYIPYFAHWVCQRLPWWRLSMVPDGSKQWKRIWPPKNDNLSLW